MINRARQSGLTYIELVIGIIIIGITVAGVLKTLDATLFGVVDPLQQYQALSIAESYLEEILAKPYADPATGQVCPSPAPASRMDYTCVCNYNNLADIGAHDQDGILITGLSNYNVSVTVSQNVFQQYERWSPGFAQGNTTSPALEVNVIVMFDNGTHNVALSGYRTNY